MYAPETRDLVRRIVNEIGYVTNRLAGSLTAGAADSTAQSCRRRAISFFANTIEGMTDALAEAGIP